MHILNFAHPLTTTQQTQIEQLTGATIEEVRAIPVQIDQTQPLAPQMIKIVDSVGLAPEQWQTLSLLINPPGLTHAALALIAELHGRTGYFPAIIRVRPIAGSMPPQFEIAEILNLQAIREDARQRRNTG